MFSEFDVLGKLEEYKDILQNEKLTEKKKESIQKKIDKLQKEKQRLYNMYRFERQLYEQESINYIAGIDEVGRGPLAGPVVVSAVILPKDCYIEGLNDSKKISESKREKLYDAILEKAVAYSIATNGNNRIDEINILNATKEAMVEAVQTLSIKPDYILIDAIDKLDVDVPIKGIIGGDGLSCSIAAASIVAKVTRDRMMKQWHEMFPEYGFDKNKGYGTSSHIQTIKEIGPCILHRKTFIKNFCN